MLRKRKAWVKRTPQTQYGGSGWAWQRTRTAVLERDNHRCRWCGGTAQTADHVLARAFGGPDTMDNLVAACHRCNARRAQQQSLVGRRLRQQAPMHQRSRSVTQW